MLYISENQMAALRKGCTEVFISRMAGLIGHLSPDLAVTLNYEERRNGASQVYNNALAHGFTKKGSIRLWLDLSIRFGIGFFDNPLYSHVTDPLRSRDRLPQMDCARLLYLNACKHLDIVSGPEGHIALAALRRLRSDAQNGPSAVGDVLSFVMVAVERIYPEKLEACGERAIRQIIERVIEKMAIQYPIDDKKFTVTMVALALVFGHRFDSDPFRPWIARTLTEHYETETRIMSDRLRSRALILLEETLNLPV